MPRKEKLLPVSSLKDAILHMIRPLGTGLGMAYSSC
jgi:hypothetical protein